MKDADSQRQVRDERLDILAGTRGNPKDHALRVSDLDSTIADLIQRMILAELKKRGL